jgi:hypothetical protein
MQRFLAAVVVVLCAACGGDPDDADGAAVEQSQELVSTLRWQLAKARLATVGYHDVNAALADGFVEAGPCVEFPEGAMGIHYINFARLDGILDIARPEALLYLPTRRGLRLIGIEYIVPILEGGAPYFGCGVDNNSCPPSNPPPKPVLFDGMPYDGPMAGHDPTLPWHFDQHVWIWSQNPAGMFFHVNPRLSCHGSPPIHQPRGVSRPPR